jgi:hypothetical protein
VQLVGLKLKETEYILIDDWKNISCRDIKIKNVVLNKVNDYKYLGSWVENSEPDFKIRK